MAGERILGVDIGGTKIGLSVWSHAGERLACQRFPTDPSSADPNVRRIIERGRALLEGRAPAAIGVSAGGPVDLETGTLLEPPNLRGWRVPVRSLLGEAFGARVAVENDANAGAVAEWLFGAGRAVRDLAFLTMGTGVGAGLILEGRLIRGYRGLAGEVGHAAIVPDGRRCGCGKRGCLEAYASGAGIARRLAEEWPSGPATAKEVVERARAGDDRARAFLEATADFLARGLANLVFIADLRRIVLGTIVVGAGDLILEPLRRRLADLLWPSFLRDLEVVPAALGTDIGDYAALATTLIPPFADRWPDPRRAP
ncbi:MAG: ROK family protein [Planctomycetes bacterium]|nr:ROK family protein [Planctomycetota bacterium]